MKLLFSLAAFVAVVFLAMGQASALGVLADVNFDTDTVDLLPTDPDYFALVDDDPNVPGPDRVMVSGPGGIHADPFGPPGNQSAVIDNFAPIVNGNSQPQFGFASIFPDDPADFTEGTIAFDLFMETPTDPNNQWWTYLNVRMGFGDENRTGFASGLAADTAITVSFRQQIGGGCFPTVCSGLFDDGNGFPGGSPLVLPAVATNVEFTLISPDPNDAFPIGMYELRLDGNLVSWGGDPLQTKQPWTTSGFPPAGAPGINTLSFVASSVGAAPDNGRVWIDNVKVVQTPEPTSIVLFSLGAGALLVRTRRRRAA